MIKLVTLQTFSEKQEDFIRTAASKLWILCTMRGDADLESAARRYLDNCNAGGNPFTKGVSVSEFLAEVLKPGSFNNTAR